MSAIHYTIAALALTGLTATSHAQSTPLGQASVAASEASVASVESVAAISEAGFKVTTGIIAVPLMVTGYALEGVGGGMAEAGEEGLAFSTEPLSVTNRIAVREPEPLPKLGE